MNQPEKPTHYEETTNAIQRFRGYQKERHDAVQKASNVISETSDGIATGLGIGLKSWRRNPKSGTVYVVGLILTPIVLGGILLSGLRGLFFPVPLQQNAAIPNRLGNAIGRGVRGTTQVLAPATKAGIAALEIQFRQQEAEKYGALNLGTSPSSNNTILTTGGNTVFTSAGKVQVNAKDLDPAVAKSIKDFLNE